MVEWLPISIWFTRSLSAFNKVLDPAPLGISSTLSAVNASDNVNDKGINNNSEDDDDDIEITSTVKVCGIVFVEIITWLLTDILQYISNSGEKDNNEQLCLKHYLSASVSDLDSQE